MKVIEQLRNGENTIDIVQIKDKKFIRVTTTKQAVWNAKAFVETLKQHSIPTLSFYNHKLLGPNQFMRTHAEKAHTLGESHTPYDFFQLGKLLRRIHAITFPTCMRISNNGKEEPIPWDLFLQGQLQYHRPDLSAQEHTQARAALRPLHTIPPAKPTLLHGHLTLDTCLKLHNSIILIDKSPDIFSGDPLYDLGWVYTTFAPLFFLAPNASNNHLREAHKAFVEGYGSNPIRDHSDQLERYVFMHLLTTTPDQIPRAIILQLLKRIS